MGDMPFLQDKEAMLFPANHTSIYLTRCANKIGNMLKIALPCCILCFYFVCYTFVGQRIYLVPQLLVQYPIPQSMIINPCLGSSGRRHLPKRYPGSKHAEMQHVRFVSFSKHCTNLPILNQQQWRD